MSLYYFGKSGLGRVQYERDFREISKETPATVEILVCHLCKLILVDIRVIVTFSLESLEF